MHHQQDDDLQQQQQQQQKETTSNSTTGATLTANLLSRPFGSFLNDQTSDYFNRNYSTPTAFYLNTATTTASPATTYQNQSYQAYHNNLLQTAFPVSTSAFSGQSQMQAQQSQQQQQQQLYNYAGSPTNSSAMRSYTTLTSNSNGLLVANALTQFQAI